MTLQIPFSDSLVAVLIALVAVVVGVMAGIILRQRRANVWRRLASRHRLKYQGSSSGPRVTGLWNDRDVEICSVHEGSDEEAGVAVVRFNVMLRSLPTGMTAEASPGLIGDLATFGQEDIKTGVAAFDESVVVRGERESTREYWNAKRQKVFLELVRSANCDSVSIHHDRLVAEERSILSRVEQLESLLDQLVEAAPELDGKT